VLGRDQRAHRWPRLLELGLPAGTLGFSESSEVVIHVIRRSRGAGVVAEVRGEHRPVLRVSDLYGAQQDHAEDWQICLAHQLRDCAYAIETGDAVFARRMKALLLRAVVLAQCHRKLAPSTRREYRRRLECTLDAVMALAPTHRDGQRLRKRYGKLRSHLFTFLDHPELPADNNGSEPELRLTATYRKVTGGFRSDWDPALIEIIAARCTESSWGAQCGEYPVHSIPRSKSSSAPRRRTR